MDYTSQTAVLPQHTGRIHLNIAGCMHMNDRTDLGRCAACISVAFAEFFLNQALALYVGNDAFDDDVGILALGFREEFCERFLSPVTFFFGIIPTFQPANFGRVYAAYGGGIS